MQQDNSEVDCNIRCYTVTVLTGLQMKVSKLNKKKYVIYFSTETYVVDTQKTVSARWFFWTPKQMIGKILTF